MLKSGGQLLRGAAGTLDRFAAGPGISDEPSKAQSAAVVDLERGLACSEEVRDARGNKSTLWRSAMKS
jgi:hypothetical protein